jgi:L-alanine-DL-glutamate epimerase-like enolase superfamily enzyme
MLGIRSSCSLDENGVPQRLAVKPLRPGCRQGGSGSIRTSAVSAVGLALWAMPARRRAPALQMTGSARKRMGIRMTGKCEALRLEKARRSPPRAHMVKLLWHDDEVNTSDS